jgi:hypothetical protein
MTREFLLAYLNNIVDCYPDGKKGSQGQLYRNSINGLETFIPNDDLLRLSCYCRIFYELKVDPPKENGYDSDYAVYSSFMDK